MCHHVYFTLHILTTNNIISQNAPSYMLDSVLNTPMQSQPKLIENEEITRKQQQMESQPSRTKKKTAINKNVNRTSARLMGEWLVTGKK